MARVLLRLLGAFSATLLLTSCVSASKDKEAAAKEEPSNVVVLTKSNFSGFLKENSYALVEFYAPWCGHCQKLTPEYEKAAEKLKAKKIPLAKVDATAETELAQEFEIGGYPTLKFFRNGKPEDYGGGRTADTIVAWVESMTGPAVTEFTDKSKAVEFAKQANVAFLGTFTSKDTTEYKTFQGIAEERRQQGKFIALFDSSPAADAKVPEVAVWRKGEGAVSATSTLDQAHLEKFVNTERFPLFGPITVNNYADYFQNKKEMVWFAGEKDDYEKYGNAVRQAAGEFRDKYNFVWLDTATFKDHAQSSLGVKDFPALVIQSKTGRFVYTKEGGADAMFGGKGAGEAIIKFFNDVHDGKVDKHYMSDPVPETNDKPVKVVVGKTFESMILHPTRDALLEVYAPWCGHCKKFEPTYEEFAQKMSSRTDLLVAKMDGTTNEAPVANFEWRGFPTIFFVKAGSDKPINFDGSRTIEGLTEFINKHSSSKAPVKDDTKEEL